MDDTLGHEITQLLQAWRRGDAGALEKLTPQVYRELHLAASRCMARELDGHTFQTTALIDELCRPSVRSQADRLAEPGVFLRVMCATNAAHSHGTGLRPAIVETQQ